MAKSRKTKKRKTDEEVFVVEVITKARVVAPDTDDEDVPPKNTKSKGKEKQKLPKAKWEYYVKWAGYGSDADSWEPQENVSSCVRLLQSFWDHVGTDNKDYLPGYEVSAKESWIKKEKAFFVRELKSEVSKTKKGSDKSKSKRRKASPSETLKRPSKEKKVSIKEESSDDDRPLALNFPSRSAPPRPQPAVVPGKRKRMVVSSEDEDSDDAEGVKNTERDPKPVSTSAPPTVVSDVVETPAQNQSPLFSATSLSPAPTPAPAPVPAPPTETKAPTPKLPVQRPSIPKPAMSAPKPPPPPLPSRISQAKPLPTRPKVDTTSVAPKEMASGARTPTAAVSSTSISIGIPTKQRVGLGAMNPIQPKEVYSRPAIMPTRTASDTFQNLSFKKITAQSTSNQAPKHNETPADAHPSEAPASIAVVRSADRTPIPSPVMNASRVASGSYSTMPLAHRRRDSTVTIQEVDNFLHDLMDPLMAAPLVSQPDTPVELVPRALHKPIAATTEKKSSQRYKWEGDLSLSPSDNALCKVKLVETTTPSGLNLKIAMAAIQTIIVSDVFQLMDICTMLAIFRPFTHLGALVPQSGDDKSSFQVLHKYFLKDLKVFLLPIVMDKTTVGQILFCPVEIIKAITKKDPVVQQAGIFAAVVLPYALSPKQKQLSMFAPTLLDPSPYPPLDVKVFPRWNSTLKKAPLFHLGMRILQFPQELFVWFLTPKDRAYTLFSYTPISPEHEQQTHLLLSVMNQTPTPFVDIRAESRLIFIHNSALHMLHTLPHLAERKLKVHPWPVHFYTYGSLTTSGKLPPVEEIYPCGGVVTFSALAIYRNPLEVCHRIEQINKHPLWTCYLAPEVLGVLTKLLFGKADPFIELTKPNFPLDPILRRIEDGDIAYVSSPPDDSSQNDAWLKRFLSAIGPSKSKALNMAVHDYLNLYKGVGTHLDMLTKLEHHMAADMVRMQRQRVLMANYRRFVIMTADSEFNGARNGTEWVHVRRFDFKDMFFTQQEVGR